MPRRSRDSSSMTETRSMAPTSIAASEDSAPGSSPTPPRTPTANPFGERVIGTLRRDCFDHIIVKNQQHAERVLHDYLAYDHGRPHRGLRMQSPDGARHLPPTRPPKRSPNRWNADPRRSPSSLRLCGRCARLTVAGTASRLSLGWCFCTPQPAKRLFRTASPHKGANRRAGSASTCVARPPRRVPIELPWGAPRPAAPERAHSSDDDNAHGVMSGSFGPAGRRWWRGTPDSAWASRCSHRTPRRECVLRRPSWRAPSGRSPGWRASPGPA
jgi:hypothetical protein